MPSSWIVVPALEALRREFNEVFPNRDTTSDGAIGDTAHGARPSGHNPDETGSPEDHDDDDDINEVRARDFDADLGHPDVSMEDVCQHLVREIRAGRVTWIKYLIFDRRIWRLSKNWAQEPYTGASPHTEHLHVSCRPLTTCENDTRPVGLETLVEDDVKPAEIQDAVLDALETPRGLKVVGRAVHDYVTVNARQNTDGTYPPVKMGDLIRWMDVRSDRTNDLVIRNTNTVLAKLNATADAVTSFDARERKEVPITLTQLRQTLDEAIPDNIGPLTPDEARAAVLSAFREAFADERP